MSTHIFPRDIIEHLLSLLEDDDMYILFSMTSKYWNERSSHWWERKYIQLGGYLPSNNTIPLRILYNQIRPQYADVLVKIDGINITTYDIPMSIKFVKDRLHKILIKLCEEEHITLLSNNTLKHISMHFSKFNNAPMLSKFKIKQRSGQWLLSDDGKVYYLDLMAVLLNGTSDKHIYHINIPPVKDMVDCPNIFYSVCLTYNQQVYILKEDTKNTEFPVSVTLLQEICYPPISIKKDSDNIYLISENKMHYLDFSYDYSGIVYSTHVHLPIDHFADIYERVYCQSSYNNEFTYFTSKNKLYKYNNRTTDLFERILDLKYIVDITLRNDGVYILGKK